MNQAVRSWNRYEERTQYQGSDSLNIEDVTIIFDKENKMAKLNPMSKGSFRTVIRTIKQVNISKVVQFRFVTFTALKRLKIKRDMTKAVPGIPQGSNQIDMGSIYAWINKIQKTDEEAIEQLVAFDATLTKRVKG